VTVRTYHLRIFFQGHQKAQWEDQLDLDNEARLGEVFVSAADGANQTMRVRDYAEWRMDVHRITEQRRDLRGARLAQVTKDNAGRTVVTRP
jgi:hypothetical protein